MNASEYKIYHESFMQNNHGSTAIHTFLCIFFTVQCSLFCIMQKKENEFTQYIFEYVIIVLSMILAHTLLSDYIFVTNALVFLLLLIEVIKKHNLLEIQEGLQLKTNIKNKRIKSITILRALTYLITGFCILAVDFQDFPRFLAKTENYGYSLMDTGVGLFVLISGLVHKDINKDNYLLVIKSNTKFIAILLSLGIARFVSVKQLDYQEHVTEYGVHWNFFFTLAVCKLLSSLLLVVYKNTLKLTITLLTIHEFLLYIGLQNWVFSDELRIYFLDANREGISSSLGYVAMYLFAVHLKNVITKNAPKYVILKKLFTYSVILVICSHISNLYQPVSRTLANIAYCLYLGLVLVFILFIVYFSEILYESNKKSRFEIPLLLKAINSNGLVYFLTSNLTTGLINMTLRTLFVSSIVTFFLLNIYMILNLCITVYLSKKNVKI